MTGQIQRGGPCFNYMCQKIFDPAGVGQQVVCFFYKNDTPTEY